MSQIQRSAIWAAFYTNLVAMQMHPGHKNKFPRDERLDELAELADLMLNRWRERWCIHGHDLNQLHPQRDPNANL